MKSGAVLAVTAAALLAGCERNPNTWYTVEVIETGGMVYDLTCTFTGQSGTRFNVNQSAEIQLSEPRKKKFRVTDLGCRISSRGGRYLGPLKAELRQGKEVLQTVLMLEDDVEAVLSTNPHDRKVSKASKKQVVAQAGAAAGPFSEAQAVTACDAAVKARLVSPGSYRGAFDWEASSGPGVGRVTIQREFTSRNAMNAVVPGSYDCVVTTGSYAVVDLQLR